MSRREKLEWLAVWVTLAVVTALAIYRLRDFPAHLSFVDAFAGVRQVFASTAWAAAKIWSFWALSAVLIAGIALRIDPEIEFSDALLIGACGLWVLAYPIGNLLGPIGLFRAPTIWALLALGAVWLWRNPPHIRLKPPTAGQKLAALAVALLAVSYLPLQLASPVVPFMDVLSYPSSVQRILTFGRYLPFDNDPYGLWGAYAQTPALELFYAMLALGSHTRLAVLAESGAMMPMAALMIFATWRLGKTLFGDTAGGAAALLLFFTCLLRRAQGMRGTAVDYALVGVGLAFFLDRSGRRILFVLGAAMLGESVGSHAIDGGFAMIVAGFGVLLWMIEGEWRHVAAGTLALAGASLIAIPEPLVGAPHPVPYPVLPLLIFSGLAVIAAAGWLLPRETSPPAGIGLRAANATAIALFLVLAIWRHVTHPGLLVDEIAANLPILALLGFAGLGGAAVALVLDETPSLPYAGLAAAALLIPLGWDSLGDVARWLSLNAVDTTVIGTTRFKLLDYCGPYFLMLPAAFLPAIFYDYCSRPLTFLVFMTILIYPWRLIANPADFDSAEHSIPEHWAFNLHDAAQGYWAGHLDNRWTFGPEEFQVLRLLDQEIAVGRITLKTHVLHVSDTVSSWTLMQFPIMTGINDDPIVYDPSAKPVGWLAGSRVRQIPALGAALAERPPYILAQVTPPQWLEHPPDGYDMIFKGDMLRLYRRHDLAGR